MANPAAGTAYGPMVIIAVEQNFPVQKRIVQDALAYNFLPPALKVIVNLTRLPFIRQWLINISDRRAPGVWAGILCRKKYIDQKLAAAIGEGIEAVVNLGAGLDTLVYRLPELKALQVFEVDLPGNIAYKEHILKTVYGAVPAHISLVPMDFENQELETVLAAHGYRSSSKSFFTWEGVTQYLTEEGIRKVFALLAKAAAGSKLLFTYVRGDFLDGTNLYCQAVLYNQYVIKLQMWRFGMNPGQVAAFLEQYGWKELEQAGSREYTDRYMKPAGRTLPVMEIERAVYAGK